MEDTWNREVEYGNEEEYRNEYWYEKDDRNGGGKTVNVMKRSIGMSMGMRGMMGMGR